ncbi:MAG TPA: type II toxin-antitoxin system VapC family toxin [Longimicrobium sp.]|jgi:PIN domain nuclease of toxin-antitoxin system
MLISELTDTDRLVLDTHIWVWASGESGGTGQVSEAALVAIEEAAERRHLFVSVASVWEMALKAERGRALVAGDLRTWVQDQRRYPGVRVMPVDSRLSIDSTILPLWLRRSDKREHRDPADRFIVAAARRLNAILLTCDEEILHYASQGHVAAYEAC